MDTVRRGGFFVLDGVDGCGKSTQAQLLVRRLAREAERPPLHVREPGGTAAGERIREVVLDPGLELGPAPQALLMVAARRQLLDELVAPALGEGRDVVCERFHPSTFAYQAWAGGLEEARVLQLLDTWAATPAPDVVVILDLPLEVALARRSGRDRFENASRRFQERVWAGYRRYAELVPEALLVAAEGPPEAVSQRVWAEVQRARP